MMRSDHIKIFKSYEQRLEEYNYILSTFCAASVVSDSIPEIICVWSIYLELHLLPKEWGAIWYILRRNCADLEIHFPKVVQVMVKNVNFNALTAQVRIINDEEVEDDFELSNLSEMVDNVPLKDLYITVYQENKKVDAYAIAEYIDQLRVFFHHLWWSWDTHSKYSIQSWCTDHLESRLKMYFDKLLGKVHYITGKRVKHLMEKGEELYENMTRYSSESSFFVDDKELLQLSKAIFAKEECFVELESIKMELDKLEIPELRKIEDSTNREKSILPRVMIVTGEGSITELESRLRSASSLAEQPDGPLNCIFKKIKDAFLEYSKNDTIIVCSEQNPLCPREHFDFAVNLFGLPEREITISDTRSHWCLFECLSNDDIRICNLAIKVRYVHSAITIKKGCVRLDHIRFEACGKYLPIAIQVCEGASLLATNCDFTNFNIAIECFGRASVKLDKCSFRDNHICLKFSPGSPFVILDCDMTKTKTIPIQLERFENTEKKIGPLSYLSSVSEINIQRCKFEDESRVVEVI